MTVMLGGPLGALPVAGGAVVGTLLLPSQTKFSTFLNNDIPNATGDGLTADVICDTILTNIGSGYNASTGVFTAPISGFYHFNGVVVLNELTTANDAGLAFFDVGGTPYILFALNVGAVLYDGTGSFSIAGALSIPLNINDTVKMTVAVASGISNDVSIGAASSFSGFLLG